MDLSKMLEQECDENYWDIVNFITSYLMKNNKSYKQSANECCDIVTKYPKLKQVLEDDIPVSLSKEEVSNLIKYIHSASDRNTMERKQLLCAGCRSSYFILQKLRLLKDKESD